ncbi:MAG: hypothetical protein LBN22_02410 [Clostridiales Family XIII bacterium]|jgi:hypothetical protein|nr:hypothetical protein [Clostridiales Family XIII bacterium]
MKYLKWNKDIIGIIDSSNTVSFSNPTYNTVVSLYTHGKKAWSSEEFADFLSERVVSRDRRDIERVLFRCGLSQYDLMQISRITRGIHPNDLLWIADSKDEKLEDVMTDVFQAIFNQRIDLVGDSIDTPEGYNIKRYGAFNGRYGIYKQRISPILTDVESEVAVYLLATKLGVPCCPAYRTGDDTVFSEFLYDFSKEYIVHFRRLFDGARGDNEYRNLVSVRPQYKDNIRQMILLDFITRQDDRHLSNVAIKIGDNSETFYPLYDNGRSLFYEDTEELVEKAVTSPEQYSTTFGFIGTYWDYVQEIANERGAVADLINLDITEKEIAAILKEAGFVGYRYDAALKWIVQCIELLKNC